jgi:hypothetical protein
MQAHINSPVPTCGASHPSTSMHIPSFLLTIELGSTDIDCFPRTCAAPLDDDAVIVLLMSHCCDTDPSHGASHGPPSLGPTGEGGGAMLLQYFSTNHA